MMLIWRLIPVFQRVRELPVNAGVDVMGYLRPKSQYNKGKVSEFEERKSFEESIINEHL